MRSITLDRKDPVVRKASTLNAYLLSVGFTQDYPISAEEIISKAGVSQITYKQDEKGLTHAQIETKVKLELALPSSFWARLKWLFTGKW